MNNGLIARILAGGMALSVLGMTVRYTSQYDSIQEGIEALKQAGVSFYNQYLVSEEEKQALQDEFDTLKAQYLDVLTALGLGEGATLEDVQNKLNELSEGEKGEVVTEIAGLLGIENATMDGVTQAIAELEEAIAQLEADITRLQTELEQANLDLQQANKEDENTVALLNGALAELEGLQGQIPSNPEDIPSTPSGEEEPEEPTVPDTPDNSNSSTEEQLALLKAEMDNAWQSVVDKLPTQAKNETDYEHIKSGNYTIDGMNTLRINGVSKGTVNGDMDKIIEAYEQARANYLNAGGTL